MPSFMNVPLVTIMLSWLCVHQTGLIPITASELMAIPVQPFHPSLVDTPIVQFSGSGLSAETRALKLLRLG